MQLIKGKQDTDILPLPEQRTVPLIRNAKQTSVARI